MSRRLPFARVRPLRIGILLITLVAGVVSVRSSLGFATYKSVPQVAYSWSPWDARVSARFAETQLGDIASKREMSAAANLARQALKRDPAVVSAAATLGLIADVQGKRAEALEWFAYSRRLSRRDLRTSLWLIENAVTRNDIPGALRNYNIALTTSRPAQGILFPVLVGALSESVVRSQVAAVLATKPGWAADFLRAVSLDAKDFPAALDFFSQLSTSGFRVPSDVEAQLLTAAVNAGAISDAYQYYAASTRDPSLIRNGTFQVAKEHITPFDWVTREEEGAVAWQEPGRMMFESGSVGAPQVAQQLIMLKPGRYKIAMTGRSENADLAQPPFLSIKCLGGIELTRLPLTATSNRAIQVFKVPATCQGQWIALTAQASEVGKVTGEVSNVVLTRVDG